MDEEAAEAMLESTTAANYIMPSLGLDHGWFIFTSISSFISSMTPNDMPLIYCILELFRDVFQSKVSIVHIILEALKMESGFICLILLIFIISVIPFGYTIAWFCSKNVRIKSRLVSDMSRNDVIFQNECKQKIEKFHCQKKIFVVILQFLVTLSVITILLMFIVNEQISSSINDTPTVLRSALKDAEFFVKSSNHQLQMDTFENFDKTRENIKLDLDDIDKLLGERITREIAIQTGLDVTFEVTAEILESTRNLSSRVQFLLNEVVLRALLIASDTGKKIEEIHTQLSVLQRQCSYRDRPLCDTLRVKSFEEIGVVEALKMLNHNTLLQTLRKMSDDNYENSLKKLNEELAISKKIFRSYLHQLQQDSSAQKEEIMKQLMIMRNGINETINKLSLTTKHVLDKIGNAWQKILPMIDGINEAGYLTWLIGLISCTSTLVITFFLLVPLSCSCCHVDNLAGITFQMGSCVLAIFTVFLGFFTIFEVLLGGHGEVFICRAFYEKPEFNVIGKLFDTPGILYSQPPTNGIFNELLVTDGRLFANQTLTKAINECELNKSAYYTFHIDHLLDLKNVLDYKNYPDLSQAINDMRASSSAFRSFTHKIQYLFEDLIGDFDANFTIFRHEINQVSPERELINFVDQLQRVSLQISDTSTTSRMGTIASSAKRIQTAYMQPLEALKNEIIYHLTALELQIQPWKEKIRDIRGSFNVSQNYLNENAEKICSNFSASFQQRLQINLEIFRNETLEELENDFGCRSLFDTFDGIRLLTCKHIIEPINGLFFLSFLVLLAWVIATPISLLLASAYGKIEDIQNRLCNINTIQSYEESVSAEQAALQLAEQEQGIHPSSSREVTWSTRPPVIINHGSPGDSSWKKDEEEYVYIVFDENISQESLI